MKIKCGIDIIEVSRIQKSIEDFGDSFLKRVYTKNEIEYCESKKNVKMQHYAARFAAKEAVFKAISELLDSKFNIQWTDIEIINGKDGRPVVNLRKDLFKKVKNIDISLSHIKDYAIANCVIEFEK